MTKSIALAAFLLAASATQAQLKFSKVSNGTKTALKSGDKVDIRVGADETVLDNIEIDLDIAAFKKAYNYDLVGIYYNWDRTTMGYYEHEFDSQLNTKKYAGKGVIPVYVFDTKNFKETDYRALKEGMYYSGKDLEGKREIVISGYYITGEEGYFDSNDNYKTRNLYSKGEPLAKFQINAIFTPEAIAAYDLRKAQDKISNLADAFEDRVVNNITQYVAPYVATPMYGALVEGFKEVWDAKVTAAKGETDPAKATAASEQLSNDYDLMQTVSKKDKSVLKTMNKAIKDTKTVEEKWELIKANA